MYQSDNLKGGHVIMLGGGCEEAALAALRAYPGGLQIGGGVTPESAQKYIDAGASHVIVTSYLFSGKELDFEKLRRMEEVVGKEKLVRPREGGRERCRRARRDEMKRKKTKAHIYVLSLLTFSPFPPLLFKQPGGGSKLSAESRRRARRALLRCQGQMADVHRLSNQVRKEGGREGWRDGRG